MAVELLEALTTNLLEDDNLVSPGLVIDDGSLNDCTFNIRSTDLYCTLILNEEYLVELNISTFGLRKSLHKDLISSLYLELLACNVYDCVHYKLCLKFGTVSACLSGQDLSCSAVIKRTANVAFFL